MAKTCLAHLRHEEDANSVERPKKTEHVRDRFFVCFQYFLQDLDFPCFNQRRAAPDVQAAINIQRPENFFV